MKGISDINVQGKTVLLREDYNVPINGDIIQNDARIRASLPTLAELKKYDAKVIIMSHMGRPKEGFFEASLSLAPVAKRLSDLTGRKVHFFPSLDKITDFPSCDLGLLENVRFVKGEKSNDTELAKRYAEVADVFVMDAFAAAHRAHASTHGIVQFASDSCAGPLLMKEVEALTQVLTAPKRPLLAIVGGAKVSSKLGVLSSLLEKVDALIVGGGMANTFLAASGFSVGASLMEPELIPKAKELMLRAQNSNKKIHLPIDVVVAHKMSAEVPNRIIPLDAIRVDEAIFDVGPQSIAALSDVIEKAGTILWNGPVGVFECTPFRAGTQGITEAIVRSSGYSVAGGGDTLAAIEMFGAQSGIDYVSTGGGAFLELVEKGALPCVDILNEKDKV